MPPYADPSRCPSCGARIVPAAESCAWCSLTLRGETAAQLFAALVRADELLAALRLSSTAAAATSAPASAQPLPARAVPTAPARAGRLTVASVPQVLLGLGAACLLVAALVFLAVTWSVLGVGGRTATLTGLTVLAAALAALLARRGLRAATESLALVGLGLLTLDLLGAERAGWFGELSTAGLLQLVGGALVATGTAAALAVRRTAVGSLTGTEVVAVLGTALLALGVAEAGGPEAPLLVLATVLPALVALGARRVQLGVVLHGAAVVAVASWLALTGHALDRTLGHDHGWAQLWLDRQVWPLLAAAALAAAPALLSWLPRLFCTGALAVAHLLLTVALLAPTLRLHPTSLTLVALVVLTVLAAAAWSLPRRWALVQSLTQTVVAAGVLAVVVSLLTRSAARLAEAAQPVWSGRAGDSLPAQAAGAGDGPAAWLLPLCALALLGTAVALGRSLGQDPGRISSRDLVGEGRLTPSALRGAAAARTAIVLAASGVAVSGVAAMALYPVPLWLVLTTLVAVAAGAWAVALRGWAAVTAERGSGSTVELAALAVTTGFSAVAVLVSLHAEVLTAVVLCAVLALAAGVRLRAGAPEVAALGGVVLAGTLAGDVWAWGAVADVAPPWVALVGLLVLGASVLLAPYLPVPRPSGADPGLAGDWPDVGAAGAAVVLAAAGALLSAGTERSVWVAVYLTVAGAVVTATALLRPERRVLAWPGGALLAAATWVRLQDLGVTAPEPYTLPTAVTLLVVGLHRLHRDPSAASMPTLAPGLALALVPTLLWTLDQPLGLRALLLGLCCLTLVLIGARTGWTAPLALGAGVGAVLLLRLAAPYVGDAVPRWALIGGAGVLLLAVGTTWERRVGEVRAALGYVRALR